MGLPSEDDLRWIVARYAHLRAAHGKALGDPELIEPSGKHFPDDFAVDPPSIGRLLERMMSYAPLAEGLPIELAFVEPGDAPGGGGCGSGACGGPRGGPSANGPLDGVDDLDDRYRVRLSVADAGHAALLTTSLARSVGALVLAEAEEEVDPREAGSHAEVAAAAAGFGLLLLNGAAVYTKSCGGLRMHRATHLSVEELAVLVALFLKLHGKKAALARSHLEATQSEAFDEAWRWVGSNDLLVSTLRDRPAHLEDGVFALEPPRGIVGRFFARRRAAADEASVQAAVARRPPKSEAERRRIAEL